MGAWAREGRLRFSLLTLLVAAVGALAPAGHAADVDLVFFWGEGCPHCAAAEPVLREIAADPRVTLHSFEVYGDPANRRLFAAAGYAFGFEAGGVPTVLVGDEVYVGFSDAVAERLRERVGRCLESGCPDPMVRILAAAGGAHAAEDPAAGVPGAGAGAAGAALDAVDLPLFGRVALAGRSELATTALIAFVDGFNPCSLWVLSLLLAVVINTRSRRKVLLVGSTFLLVAAAVYALMLAGLVNVLGLVAAAPWVRASVAMLALAFALVNLKDYVWYRQGISLSIPEGRRPGIYRGIRGVMRQERSTVAMLGATAAMAAGVTVFELPCTVGFPVLWADLVLQWQPGALAFGGLLAVYLAVFLVDELALFGAAVVTLRAARLEERQGRVLKLVGGMVMLFLAAVMLLRPAWMNELGPAAAVVGAALLAALLVHLLARALRLVGPEAAGGEAVTARSGRRSWERASAGARRGPRVRRDR